MLGGREFQRVGDEERARTVEIRGIERRFGQMI